MPLTMIRDTRDKADYSVALRDLEVGSYFLLRDDKASTLHQSLYEYYDANMQLWKTKRLLDGEVVAMPLEQKVYPVVVAEETVYSIVANAKDWPRQL